MSAPKGLNRARFRKRRPGQFSPVAKRIIHQASIARINAPADPHRQEKRLRFRALARAMGYW